MHWAFPEANITDAEKWQLMPWCDPSLRTPVDTGKQKAIDLLKEAGYPNGVVQFSFPWYGVGTRTGPGRDIYGSLYTDLAAAGFKFSTTTAGNTEQLRAGRFEISTGGGCGTPVVDPSGGVSNTGLSFSALVGGRPWVWPGVEQADELYTRANKLLDPIARGAVLKDLERFYARPGNPVFWFGWTEQFMTVPECVRNFQYGPGNFGLEHANTWMREGYCRQTDGPKLIEPKDLNPVKTVMWNWQ